MKRSEVRDLLGRVKAAKKQHAFDEAKFQSDVSAVMRRLLHEAAANLMSVEEVARDSGYTVKRIRQMMRDIGLNPTAGRNLLSKKAAEALATNADLMGIEPSEMDLMSPLAYLPMGEQLRRQLQDSTVSQVTALDEVGRAEVSGNVRLTEAEMNRLTNFLDFYNRGVESISGLIEEVTGIVESHLAARA